MEDCLEESASMAVVKEDGDQNELTSCEDTIEGETFQSEEPCSKVHGEIDFPDLESTGKHISIQKEFSHLEALAEQCDIEKKPCPLCPQNKYRSCHINKLIKHLKNLHWKVSVELEGYRMCICCLPCAQNTAQNENGVPGKMSPHYHCIICSSTVVRRTEMLKHIKRHVEKGEIKASSSYGRPQETLKEANTEIQVLPNFTTPQASSTFFNPVMKTNRQLIFCALAVLAEERKPLECLDAFSSTGIMGLQWAKHLGNSVKVTINDINDSSVARIRENCHLNKIRTVAKADEMPEATPEISDKDFVGTVEVTNMDANILMHMRSFDFIHLDPFGTSVNYLDAAFRNVRNLGIISITSTDTSSLYAKNIHVAKRHYGCNLIRTEYYRELAARVVLGAVARTAARCNKGIEVLLSVALDHFVLVIVRVLRGPSLADESTKMINNLIHCNWCEERIFQKEGTMVEENPYEQLPCDCHLSTPGRSAVLIGPVWSGSLFNAGFLKRMLFEATTRNVLDIHTILKTLICESECTTLKQFPVKPNQGSQTEEGGVFIKISEGEIAAKSGKRKYKDMNTQPPKRQKSEVRVEHPPFYYSLHRHAIGGLNIPKLNRIMQYFSKAGFVVSRTHFDPTGIRTNASLATLKAILKNNRSLSNTSQVSTFKEELESQSEGAPLQDEDAPLQDEDAPLQDEYAPLQDEYAPLQEEYAPLQDEYAPLQDEDAPLQDEDAPLQDEDAPLQDEDAPLQDEDAPLQDEDAPPHDEALYQN
ncbi:tRNA (guanine(27)-N(2))-dimethyltransferase isoform X2 [Ranitomeya variabilis]|uniref:tRNA (guanine(27)-N(2))-dimethyltransferase isoform X2 n=1 Tax=Ranitomeya variabilis TaxID=490064 RepID=UPI0040563519